MRTRLARAGEGPDRKRCRCVARRRESVFELDSRRRREEKGERFELDSLGVARRRESVLSSTASASRSGLREVN
jgi:hypothetical protein